MGIDETKTTVKSAKREENRAKRARAKRLERATEEWMWDVMGESGLYEALREWVSSLTDAEDTIDRSGTDDKCRDQILFELSCADDEVKARVIEALNPSRMGILKLHEILAQLEPLTCLRLKEND
jgi:hypothetical protein